MPELSYQDLTLSLGAFGTGDVRVQLRSLDEKLTKEQLMELIYPIFDAKEKALALQTGTPST
jgi:hypothetical protein